MGVVKTAIIAPINAAISSNVIKKFSEVSAVNLTDAKKASVTNSNATNNNYLIVIFDQPFSSIDVDTQTVPVDYYRLLIKPCIVDAVYWKRGYFFAKGNRSVPLVDELDYGFWSFRRQSFQNLNGEPMESNPIVMGIYGVTTITGVASEMKRALIAKGIL